MDVLFVKAFYFLLKLRQFVWADIDDISVRISSVRSDLGEAWIVCGNIGIIRSY